MRVTLSPIQPFDPETADRFKRVIENRIELDPHYPDCWLYRRHVDDGSNNYRFCWWMGDKIRVHSLMFRLFRGDVPTNSIIRHLCTRKDCCNPDHLELANASKFAAEMIMNYIHTQ